MDANGISAAIKGLNWGDIATVDGGTEKFMIVGTGRYASQRPFPIEGCTVRPVDGGRAKVVANRRLRVIERPATV